MHPALIFSALVILVSLEGIISGEGTSIKDAPVPVWVCWVTLVIGIISCFVIRHSVKSEKNRRKRPDPIIDAEYAKDKESMDEWYVEEHGKLPDFEEAKKSTDEWYARTYGKKRGSVKQDTTGKDDK